jgi:hypothetical protein
MNEWSGGLSRSDYDSFVTDITYGERPDFAAALRTVSTLAGNA